MSQVVGKDMIIGMGYIGLDPGRLYRMHRGPKLIDAVVTGTDITIKDAAEGRAFKGLRVFGRTDQKGTPSPETPQEMETAGKSGNLGVAVSDGADHSQSLTLSTPNGLPGIPVSSGGNYTDAKGQQWVCDEIDLEREKYIERRWQEVFDGSEDWRIYSSSRFKGYMIDGILPFSDSRRAGFCNMFTVSENTEIIESIWLGGGNSILYTVSNRFYDESLEDKGLANWKAFLAENPMKVMTYLDTPIERGLAPEEIAAYKALRTYSPTTVVSNDAAAWMEVTYER